MTTRSYADALAYAEKQHKSPSINWTGKCQMFARSCVGAAPFGLTAAAAWHSIPDKYKHTGTPPPGSLPYWLGGSKGYGHTAFACEGGNIWSSDILRTGKIDKVPYTKIEASWGQHYVGYITWTPSGELHIMKPVVAKKVVHVSRVQPGDKGDEVLILQKALKAEPKIKLDYSSAPGTFGPRTLAAYAEWQTILGFKKEDADGAPGITSLKELASRHGFLAAP